MCFTHPYCDARARAQLHCSAHPTDTRQEKRTEWCDCFEMNVPYLIEVITSQIRVLLDQEHRNVASEARGKLWVMRSDNVYVSASKRIAKDELHLVPVTEQVYITKKSAAPNGSLNLGLITTIKGDEKKGFAEDVQLYAYLQPVFKIAYDNGKPKDDNENKPGAKEKETFEFISPFWCVTATLKPDEANMRFDLKKLKNPSAPRNAPYAGDYKIPILTNSKELKPGDVLYYLTDDFKNKYPSVDILQGAKRRRTSA